MKKIYLAILLLLSTHFAATSQALSGNYTIDLSQAASSTNFTNFSSAASALSAKGVSAAVVFTVAAGTYTDSFSLAPINGASATNTITFDGVDTATRMIRTLGNLNNVISLYGASFIRIKNLSIMARIMAADIWIEQGCSHVLIDSCNFRGTTVGAATSYGVYFKGILAAGQTPPNHITISNCRFKDVNYCIRMEAGFVFGYRNEILRNTMLSAGTAMWLEGVDSILVSENIVRVASSNGIYFRQGHANQCTRNLIAAPATISLAIYYQWDIVVENNMVYSVSRSNYCLAAAYAYRFKIYHNTFAGFNEFGNAAAIGRCKDGDVRNNIFYTASKFGYCMNAVEPGQFAKLDYNVYHNANKSSKYVDLEAVYYSDFASLKGQNGFNEHSTDAKPPFIDTAQGIRNLHLLASLVPSYGDSTVGVTYDFDDESRCKITPTIGADESKYSNLVSDFASPDTAWLNSPLLLTNKGSHLEAKFFEWYVDGDTMPTYTTQDIWHTFTSLGTHTVRLKTTNCFGSHDTTKTIMVANQTKAPKVYFRADLVDIDMNEEVLFTDSTTDGPTSWLWSIKGGTGQGFGTDYGYTIGDSTSQHPKVVFYSQGFYEICLNATNAIGSTKLCKTAYIKVSPVVIMCASTVSHDSTGHFYDAGGKTGKLPNVTTICELLINPCSGPVTMTFDKIVYDTTNNWQMLKLYDGFDTLGTLLSPKKIKQGAKFTAQSGHLFIRWECKQWGMYQGWEASWTTQYKFIAKIPTTIKTVDSAYSYGTEYFEVTNFQKGASYEWDCNNDGTIDFQGSTGNYTFGAAGTYTCVSYTTSCGGLDTVISTIVIADPTSPPSPVQFVVDVTNGSACNLKPQKIWSVQQNESVTLLDKSGMVPTSWEWKVLGISAANYSWDNSDTIKNPSITFYKTGNYTISLTVSNAAGTSSDTFYSIIKVVSAHCTPTVTNKITGYWGITEYSFKDIYQASSWQTGYTSYVGTQKACVMTGKKYGFSMKRGNAAQNAQTSIWIDYNQDGDFDDVGEQVKYEPTLTTTSWSDSIKIPKFSKDVLWGLTVMRVAIGNPANAFKVCGTNDRGEFEDYSIYLIDDGVPPIITLLGKDTVKTEQGLTFKDPGARAYDLVDGFVPTTSKNNIDKYTLGYYWVRYDAKDKDGNVAIPVYRVVQVTPDKSTPKITLLGSNPYYHEVNTSFNEPWATAYDSTDGNINNITTKGSVNTSVLGSYKIWYYAADSRGNKDSVMRTVVVQDKTAPQITLLGSDTVYLPVFTQYSEAGWTVTDNYDLFPKVSVSPSQVDSSILQTITLTYTATDSSGNSDTKTRVVIIKDKVSPVVKLIGADTVYVEVKTGYTELGFTTTDNYWQVVNVAISGSVDTNLLGTYTLTYTASDGSGNTAFVNRVVIVQKTTPPTIYLNGNDTVYLFVNQTYNDPGVNSIGDAYYSSNSLMLLLQSSTTFDNPATSPGTYYTWYFVTDPSNNSDTATRTFIIATNGIRYVSELSQITLWPNPASDILNITGLDKGINMVTIYDAAGKQVMTESIKGENGTLNTVNLAAGVYILKSFNDGKQSIARFEIVR